MNEREISILCYHSALLTLHELGQERGIAILSETTCLSVEEAECLLKEFRATIQGVDDALVGDPNYVSLREIGKVKNKTCKHNYPWYYKGYK